MKFILYLTALFSLSCSPTGNQKELSRLEERAKQVTIFRDTWGIPHVYGKTDAYAVFGLIYAQCEQNFEKVERNYIEVMGRMAEVYGPAYLYNDLLSRALYDSSEAKADYRNSPEWLKKLLDAFADGVNYFLLMNPGTKPLLLHHFEPWFALMFTDGAYIAKQTGGLEITDLKNLYPLPLHAENAYQPIKYSTESETTGSNAFAISPGKTANKKALLYINPHVSFYFRTEMHIASDEGLNAYGAVTWGQFFIYQGFNQHCGWMHTSSQADAADLYQEKIVNKQNDLFYEYKGKELPVQKKDITLRYNRNGKMESFTLKTLQTLHGPVLGLRNNKWLALKAVNRSMNGLIQSWQRIKANDLAAFEKVLELRTNVSTNTMYADDKGNIAYWHGNFVPKRDPAFDWSAPVDGTNDKTDWQGIHELKDLVHFINPPRGWLQNCNSTPFTAAGKEMVSRDSFPAYMAPDHENFRSLLAIRELSKEKSFSMEKLTAIGYNRYLSVFDTLLPVLFKSYDQLKDSARQKTALAEPIRILKSWDRNSSDTSIATTLATEWAYNLLQVYSENPAAEEDQVKLFSTLAQKTDPVLQLKQLEEVQISLQKYYGTWRLPFGEINRFQRPELEQQFDDSKKSYPVGMASALFGSLPSFETVWRRTNRGYGVAGNSFVAVVEFGDSIKARSVVAGGQSFQPGSKNYNDQVELYINGNLKEVYFYKDDVKKHAVREYHPGL